MSKIVKIVICSFVFLLMLLIMIWVIRVVSSNQLDDVSPGISCEKNLIEKSESLAVIPLYRNISIAENKEWCAEIRSLNKTLVMHGVYHSYNEFLVNISLEDIQRGKEAFKECFGYYPQVFEAPQLALRKENVELLKENGLKIRGFWFNVFHKVYHCEDTGEYSNKFIDII